MAMLLGGSIFNGSSKKTQVPRNMSYVTFISYFLYIVAAQKQNWILKDLHAVTPPFLNYFPNILLCAFSFFDSFLVNLFQEYNSPDYATQMNRLITLVIR